MSAYAMNFRATVAKRRDMQSSRAFKNGRLLSAAEAAGFEVIITVDQGIPYQQNMEARRIGILILCAATNRLRDLQKLIPLARPFSIPFSPAKS